MKKNRQLKFDGRKKSERFKRVKNCCTYCGYEMPENKRTWGLVWDNSDHGICLSCLTAIRSSIDIKAFGSEETI
jgi:hypothetical protein